MNCPHCNGASFAAKVALQAPIQQAHIGEDAVIHIAPSIVGVHHVTAVVVTCKQCGHCYNCAWETDNWGYLLLTIKEEYHAEPV